MLPNDLVIHFDGACTKNPGGIATFGYTISDTGGNVSVSFSSEACRGEGASCNVAEWAGLTAAIRYLKSQGWTGTLSIYGDSKLVISQLNGSWKCNKPHLKTYLNECHTLLEGIQWLAWWIPREQNQSADLLSRS